MSGGGPSGADLTGSAINRYRGTQAVCQLSIVAPQATHSKLAISRAFAMYSVRL
jgi:hypothetical protein